MIAVFQTLRFAFGLLVGLLGITMLVVGLLIAELEYLDLFNTGIYVHDFTFNGNSISVPVVLVVLGVTASVLIAFAALIIRCKHPFGSTTRSP